MFKKIRLKKYQKISLKVVAGIFVFYLAFEVNFLWLFGHSPSTRELKNPEYALPSEIYTADSVLIGKYFKENRMPVTFGELSPDLVNALVATEDVRFYSHNGLDMRSLFSSAWSTAGGDKRGGSTLTQQLAKNLFKTREKHAQGLLGYIPGVAKGIIKLREWIIAVKLEAVYDKEEILTMYLNTVSFGNNTYGIRVASKTYFSKEPANLSINESALLVGMLKATSSYNPKSKPERALSRRNVVLSQLSKYGYIEKELSDSLSKLPLGLNINQNPEKETGQSYIRTAAANAIKDWCKDNGLDIYSDGLKIYTSIDSKLQELAEEAVAEQMKRLQSRFYSHWGRNNPWTDENKKEIPGYLEKLVQKTPYFKFLKRTYDTDTNAIKLALSTPKMMRVFTWRGERDTLFSTSDSVRYYSSILQTGLMTLDPFEGKIKAWVGGINPDHFHFDHVNQSKRQPGSTFKPFAYAAALDNGYSPCDRLVDERISIKFTENGEEKVWAPQNSDWVFTGHNMTLRRAMARSCNSITAKLTQLVGWDKVAQYARDCGITSPLKEVPSVSLGTNEVTLYEMVKAYGTFLNKGIRTEPLLVVRIADRHGKVLAEFKPQTQRVMSEETAWLMLYMFRGGIQEPRGTSQALWEYDLFRENNEIGGKTGTSSNYADGWYMGITKDLVTGVWVGADDRNIHFTTSETGEGSRTALPIYGKFMEKVYRNPECGITLGKFPDPAQKISKPYQCFDPVFKEIETPDSLNTDFIPETATGDNEM